MAVSPPSGPACDAFANWVGNLEASVQHLQWLGTGVLRATLGNEMTEDYPVPRVPDFVLTGCTVASLPAPNALSFSVAAGTYQLGEIVRTRAASGNVTLAAGNATNPRIDLIELDTSGAAYVVAGTAGINPAKPTATTGRFPLAYVYVPANAGTGSTGSAAASLLDGAENAALLLNVVQVTRKEDFGALATDVNGNYIQLTPNTVYNVHGPVDIGRYTLRCNGSVTIRGFEGTISYDASTGNANGAACILWQGGNLTVDRLTFIWQLSLGDTTDSIRFVSSPDTLPTSSNLIVTNCAINMRIGKIGGCDLVIFDRCYFSLFGNTSIQEGTRFVNTARGPYVIDGCYINYSGSSPAIEVDTTFATDYPFRVSNCLFQTNNATTTSAILVENISNSFQGSGAPTSIKQGNFQVYGNSFNGGGQKLSVSTAAGTERFKSFFGNEGMLSSTNLADTRARADSFIIANATATAIPAAGTFVELTTGALTHTNLSFFESASATLPRMRFTGSKPRQVMINARVNLTAGNNQTLQLKAYKQVAGTGPFVEIASSITRVQSSGGGVIEGATVLAMDVAREGDVYTLYVANTGATTAVTCTDIHFLISEI